MDQAAKPAITDSSPVVELRQYILKPGQRDVLMSQFEKHFVTSQQATGVHMHGEFRDVGDPDRFVWLRGFRSLPDRARDLDAFYKGPVWKEHRNAANATMVDVGNVLLLQPVDGTSFTLARKMAATMVATIYLLQSPVDAGFVRFFEDRVKPVMAAAGAPPVAELKTLKAENNFPKLAIREGENAYVSISAFGNDAEYRRHLERLAQSPDWEGVERELKPKVISTQTLVLHPTQPSLDRSRAPYRYSLDVTGDIHDFDFIHGEWASKQWRLKERGVGSSDWDYFEAKHWSKVLLNGVANVDTAEFPTKGWAGATFRHFDMEKRQWSIYWVSSRNGKMDFPGQVGGFSGNVGLFYGVDTDNGKPIKVVYRWEKIGTGNARWEQAFSYDEGRTWETNWVMEMTKVK